MVFDRPADADKERGDGLFLVVVERAAETHERVIDVPAVALPSVGAENVAGGRRPVLKQSPVGVAGFNAAGLENLGIRTLDDEPRLRADGGRALRGAGVPGAEYAPADLPAGVQGARLDGAVGFEAETAVLEGGEGFADIGDGVAAPGDDERHARRVSRRIRVRSPTTFGVLTAGA